MSIVERTGFEPNHVKVIKKAFLFLKQKIQQFGENKKEMVDTSHHAVIDKEIKNVIDRIVWAEDWLKIEGMKFSYRMGKKPFQNMMNVIRSALELYLKDTKEAKNKSNIASFDSKIGDITRVIRLDSIKEGSPKIYDKYFELEPKEEVKRIKEEKVKQVSVLEDLPFPQEILDKLPTEVKRVIEGIQSNFKHGFPDFCFMGIRKALSIGIDIRFKRDGKYDKLFDPRGEPYKLPKRIELAKQEKYLSSSLASKLKKEAKVFGDVALHDYRIDLKKEEVPSIFKFLRLALEHMYYKES